MFPLQKEEGKKVHLEGQILDVGEGDPHWERVGIEPESWGDFLGE